MADDEEPGMPAWDGTLPHEWEAERKRKRDEAKAAAAAAAAAAGHVEPEPETEPEPEDTWGFSLDDDEPDTDIEGPSTRRGMFGALGRRARKEARDQIVKHTSTRL